MTKKIPDNVYRFHQDDRGTRYCNLFPQIKGEVDVTIIEPGAAVLWHRHEHQDDFQIVVKGSLKIGICNGVNRKQWHAPQMSLEEATECDEIDKAWHVMYDEYWYPNVATSLASDVMSRFPKTETRCEWYYVSEKSVAKNGPLFIPRGLWHGCYNYTNEPAVLVYYITQKFNPNDEFRGDPWFMGWEWEREVK